jgi:hypothetical protein
LTVAFDAIMNLHRQDFPSATAPVAPLPPAVDEQEIRARHQAQALRGIGLFQRATRARARQAASYVADQEILATRTELARQQQQWQAYLDRQWAALCAYDPETVISTLGGGLRGQRGAGRSGGGDRGGGRFGGSRAGAGSHS